MHSVQVMAASGFFFSGNEDWVQCFFCGGHLSKWGKNDNVWKEHLRWFPDCLYALHPMIAVFLNLPSDDVDTVVISDDEDEDIAVVNDYVDTMVTSDDEDEDIVVVSHYVDTVVISNDDIE